MQEANIQETLFACDSYQGISALATFTPDIENKVYITYQGQVVCTLDKYYFPVFCLKFIEFNTQLLLVIGSNDIQIVYINKDSLEQCCVAAKAIPSLYFDCIMQIDYVENEKMLLCRTGDKRLVAFELKSKYSNVPTEVINYKKFETNTYSICNNSIAFVALNEQSRKPYLGLCKIVRKVKDQINEEKIVDIEAFQFNLIDLDSTPLKLILFKSKTLYDIVVLYTDRVELIKLEKRKIDDIEDYEIVHQNILVTEGSYNNVLLHQSSADSYKLICVGHQMDVFDISETPDGYRCKLSQSEDLLGFVAQGICTDKTNKKKILLTGQNGTVRMALERQHE